MNFLLVYSPRESNRLTYILKTLLLEGLGIDFKGTTDLDEFYAYPLPKLNYSELLPENSINIKPHTILFDHGIRDYHLQVKGHPSFQKIFFKNNDGDIPFDILGAAFWLLSRYEEYLPHKSDPENRFAFKSSVAYQYDFLQQPLVNHWLNVFRDIIKKKFPLFEFKTREYNFISTIDIDNVFKYKHKGFVRTMAGFIADKSWSERKRRVRIILEKEEDPFDCYDFLIKAHKQTNTKAIYFFLLGDYGPNDKNHSSSDLRFQSLIKHLADYSMVGIHPSYGSNNNLKQLKKEASRLGNITHKMITKSRQHFSMLRFPHTYKDLLQAGIYSDYSLGYTNYNGFRASYCFPFKWYSLEIESVSSLTLHPYCINELTLISESELYDASKMELSAKMIREVTRYGGELVSIFHNDTFTPAMKEFYTEFLKVANNPGLLDSYGL